MTDWSRVSEALVLHKFDLYVQMMLTLVSYGQWQACPDYIARGLELRADVLDAQLGHIREAKEAGL